MSLIHIDSLRCFAVSFSLSDLSGSGLTCAEVAPDSVRGIWPVLRIQTDPQNIENSTCSTGINMFNSTGAGLSKCLML